jgi:hypothetical protein
MPKFPIPEDLIDIIKELVIIEEEEKKKQIKDKDFGERLYDYDHLPPNKEKEEKQIKIEISLE